MAPRSSRGMSKRRDGTSLAKLNPTILADVQDPKPEQPWTPGEFDMVWGSPPCTECSLVKSAGAEGLCLRRQYRHRMFRHHPKPDKQTSRFLQAVEDPYTGCHKTWEHIIQWAPFLKRAGYCKSGSSLAENLDCWTPRPICNTVSWCEGHDGARHPGTEQRGHSDGYGPENNFRQTDFYAIPVGCFWAALGLRACNAYWFGGGRGGYFVCFFRLSADPKG